MQIAELLAHLKTDVAGEGDFVTEKTIVAHDDRHLLVQPPNFSHAYRLKLTDAFVTVHRTENKIDDDPHDEPIPIDEFAADMGELHPVKKTAIATIMAVKFHPDTEPGKLLRWANGIIGDDIEAVFKQECLDNDWEKIIRDARNNPQKGDDGDTYGTDYLGSVLTLTPSGKFYTPFAGSNTYQEEANVDQCWRAALEDVAEEKGGWIQGSEGDGCDILFGIAIESEEGSEEEEE